MSRPQVLSVGQCGYDRGQIAKHLGRFFDAEVTPAETFEDALAELRRGTFDLVLVNRVTDLDGSPGLDLIRTLKEDASLSRFPVMLVSDLSSAQSEAVALGALPGFGKSALKERSAPEGLESVLSPDAS